MAINSIRLQRFCCSASRYRTSTTSSTTLSTQLATGVKVDHLCRHGRQRGLCDCRARAAVEHHRPSGHDDQHQHDHLCGQHRAAVACRASARRCRAVPPAGSLDSEQHRTDRRAGDCSKRNCPSMLGILNTQVGDRYIFSGSAINTPAVASADTILNGTGTQAGLKQVIAERTAGRSRHQRPRPAGDFFADADIGVRWRKMSPVRRSASS